MSSKKHVFTPMEKKHFVNILKEYSSVIENKNTDGATLRAKNVAWENLTSQYNASPHATSQVSTKQLRRLWMNLKQRQRDALTRERQQVQRDALTEQQQGQRAALTRERQYRLGTGGGPPIADAAIDPDVSQVAPALLVSIQDAIDSDTIQENTNNMSQDIFVDSQPVSETVLIIPSTSQITPSATVSIQQPMTFTPPPPPPLPSPPPAQTPPPPSAQTPPPPPTPMPQMTFASQTQQKAKNTILENEFKERQRRANELHELELLLLREKIREAKAKADLAELQLRSAGASMASGDQ